MNKLIRSAVGADLSCTSPIYRPSLAWNSLTLAHGCNNQEHRPSNQTDISKKKWECRGQSPLPGVRGCPSLPFFLAGRRPAHRVLGRWQIRLIPKRYRLALNLQPEPG